MPFKITVTHQDMDDSFYFRVIPTKQILIDSIRKNKRIADENWGPYYDAIIDQIREFDEFPTRMVSNLAHRGFPLKNECSIGFTQFHFSDDDY